MKKWNRAWKIRLIEENNPNWDDLIRQSQVADLLDAPPPRGMTASWWATLPTSS